MRQAVESDSQLSALAPADGALVAGVVNQLMTHLRKKPHDKRRHSPDSRAGGAIRVTGCDQPSQFKFAVVASIQFIGASSGKNLPNFDTARRQNQGENFLKSIKAVLAFAVILEFAAMGALQWPGTGQAHSAQAAGVSRSAADIRSTPVAEREPYAPCGIVGEACACSP